MRRRRNADAPNTGANGSDNTPDESLRDASVEPESNPPITEGETAEVSTDSSVPRSDTRAPRSRRRTEGRSTRINLLPGGTPSDVSDPLTDDSGNTQPSVEADAVVPSTQKAPTRKRTATRKTGTTGVAPDEPALAEAPKVSIEPILEETVEPIAPPVNSTKARRTSRRKDTPVDVPAVEVAPTEMPPAVETPIAETLPVEAPIVEAIVAPPSIEPEETIAEAPVAETSPSERNPRNRGRKSRNRDRSDAGANTNASPTTEETPASPVKKASSGPATPASAPQSTSAPADSPASEDSGNTSGRVRGLRRRLPQRPQSGSTTASPPVVPPVRVIAQESESVETAPASRRVRGLRRTIARPVTVTPVAPATVAAVEAIPPRYQPLAAEVLSRLAEGRVAVSKNVPELRINGEAQVPVWFFVNTEDAESPDTAIRQIRMAYDAGVRIFTVLTHLPWKGRSGERRFDPLDNALQLIAENAPDAFVLPRLIFSPTSAWIKQHENDMIRYADGEIGDVSIASTAFWEGDAEEALRAAVEHIAEGPHAGRVFGYYLEHGEWFYEKGRGYDLSEANRAGFRAWLRNRYRNNPVALRASWYDMAVTFDRAEIPVYPAPAGPTLFYSRREQRYRDYHEYASDIVAQVILNLGKAIKETSGDRSVVAVSYGYTLELPRAASGHLALGTLLKSPFVDILTGPLSYSARTPGGSAPLPVPLDSIHLAGKLWVSEDDTKTYLSADDTPDTYNPRIENAESTWAVHSRNFGAAVARGAGISYMDLWGQGWLEDRELWRGIGRLRKIAEVIGKRRQSVNTTSFTDPDVAVIVDERTYFDTCADETLLGSLITQQRDALLRSGARIGYYLLSDLLKPDFPESVRLLIFLNAFRIPDAIRSVIRERFQSNGRTLAWIFGPGALEDNLSELTDVLGMSIRLQPWGSKSGTQILSNVRSPLTDAIRGQRLGEEARCNPSFYATDPKAQVLGEYVGNGNPSLVVRKHSRWQSVFIGEMSLPLPLLKGLYRLAGVPTFTTDDDVAWVGDNIVCLHSAPGGGTNIYLPEEAVLVDLLTDEVLSSDGFGARLSMPPKGTRLLFFGTAEDVALFGIDPRSGPPGLTRAELPTLPPLTFDEASVIPNFTAEDEALFVAALTDDLALPDKESDEEEEDEEIAEVAPALTIDAAAAEAVRKRRRRRRRRGRGDRDAEQTDAELDPTLGDRDGDDEDESDELLETTVRVRPSLEELLPLSDVPVDTDTLPIPDEFLIEESFPETEESGESGRGRQRTRRGGARRGRRAGASDAARTILEPTAPESSPDVELDVETGMIASDMVTTGDTGNSEVIAVADMAIDVETGEVDTEETEVALPEEMTDSAAPLSAYDIFDDRE